VTCPFVANVVEESPTLGPVPRQPEIGLALDSEIDRDRFVFEFASPVSADVGLRHQSVGAWRSYRLRRQVRIDDEIVRLDGGRQLGQSL